MLDDNKESTTQYQSTSCIHKVLKRHFGFSIFRKREDSIGLLLPSLSHFSYLQFLDISFCNLLQIPDAIGWLHCLEILRLGGNRFVTLPPSIEELSKLRKLNLNHCKQLKYLPELPSITALPIIEDILDYSGLYIFDCPSLIDTKCCYRMAFSWMVKLLQVHVKSNLPIGAIDIIIPRTQIPMWCSTQNVGSSIRMDPLPIMREKNCIGVACCLTFVAHDDPNSLGEGIKRLSWFGLGFQDEPAGMSSFNYIPVHVEKDLITVDLDHLLLRFISKEHFKSETLDFDISSGLELAAEVGKVPGLRVKVKSCGYRWIFEEDLEQLNPRK
ncbi:putative leucine-rich repeat domain, L domain-containing protein [Medicago truncatula]|nr:putative leucine-rich repeat domain, L domain-containing protein [Medicago truncatula]